MMRKFMVCFCISMFINFYIKAQVNENFNDGDFTHNPVWGGNVTGFIINSSAQLQSNNTIANSTFYLSTSNALAMAAEWNFYVQIAFNPSSANYIDVYLTSADSDLTVSTNTGYFVRIGNTDDDMCLYRKDAAGAIKIIDGVNGVLNTSNNVMKIKVVRDANNQWTLSRDVSGTGNSFTSEGSVTDATYTTSAYFGFLIKQSTSSFFQRHYFDDITISNYEPDVTPPTIKAVTAVSNNAADVLFSEPIDATTAQTITNYSATSLGSPAIAIPDASNNLLVHLTFAAPFSNGTTYTLTVNGIMDLSGNAINNGTATFSFYTPQQYDIVIDEIMADPDPQVGLPNNEWIELKNTSAFSINLKGWKLGSPLALSGEMPNYILQPDSFVIICTSSAVAALSAFGSAISVTSFPSLANSGQVVSLYSSAGQTIHSVAYSSSWYQNVLKANGGWTLEMIDTKNPCSGMSNWKASIDNSGGTPGRKNSIDGINKDQASPKLLRAFALNNSSVALVFDEPLDSLKAATAANYSFGNGFTPVSAAAVAPLFNTVNITVNTAINANTIYTVTAANVTDCAGNNIGSANTARYGLAQDADSLDIVINEILYNPKPTGADYVELYNRSKKIVDLSHIYIANRNGNAGVIGSMQQLSAQSQLMFPGDYIVITSDSLAVLNQYLTTNAVGFVVVSSMPSYPNDAGYVLILNKQGNVIDEVDYLDKWQFPLISNTQGVSLERINYNGASISSNFHSASSSSGYGTPGYKNSQYQPADGFAGTITVAPDVFSPDNDGTDDFATITYNFPTSGFVTNITIFDASGHPVRKLEQNALSGISGYYRWDGLNDKNQKLPQGIYIIYTEIFNTSGRKKQFKNTIVLARRR